MDKYDFEVKAKTMREKAEMPVCTLKRIYKLIKEAAENEAMISLKYTFESISEAAARFISENLKRNGFSVTFYAEDEDKELVKIIIDSDRNDVLMVVEW